MSDTLRHPAGWANTTFGKPMTQKCPIWRSFCLPLALLAAAVPALAIDVPVAAAFRAWNQTSGVRSYLGLFGMFETFGHGLGVIVLTLAIHQLDPKRRWAIPRVLTCALAAGLAADLVKLLVFRMRPYDCPLVGSVWTTFGAWFPLWNAGSSGQSFPSAHTATAVGFAAALCWLYPQGRWLFSILAALVGCQRIVCGAHFPSDVLVGAATGCVASLFLLKIGPLPAWFDRKEAVWRACWEGSVADAEPMNR